VKPRLSDGLEEAADELDDNAEWTSVVAASDYVGQQAEGVDMRDVLARGGRWSGVILERFLGTELRFENCDLAGFVLRGDSFVQRAEFVGCRMTGAVFAGTKLRDVSFVSCTLDEANLRMLDAESVDFEQCSLLATDLYSAKLVKTRFADCDMRGAVFTKATLSECDLRTSRLEDIVGADALRSSTIGADQLIPLARSLAVALDLRIVDDELAD
jgi:uncharacterized protein YjbI with pentapeptide repeats